MKGGPVVLAYLSLGSNLGDRSGSLAEARERILDSFPRCRFSKVYETEPVDLLDQPWFLNQVAEIETALEPDSLLEWAGLLEKGMGRQRMVPKGPRTLDVDILLYGDRVLSGEGLQIPHPRMGLRRHVLVPLADLAPETRIPADGRTVRQALEQVKDGSQVRLYAPS